MFDCAKLKNDSRGFELIEVLVSIGIFSLITVGVMAVYLTGSRYNSIVWEQLKTQNEGRKATQDFVNQIRTASQSSIGAYPIQTASSSNVTFYSNIDSDTLIERIRYFMSNKSLNMGILKPTGNPLIYNSANEVTSTVAHDVNNTSSIFYYYDENFTGTQSALSNPVDVTKIRMVRMVLKLDENPNLTPAPFYIESKAVLRNLKDN